MLFIIFACCPVARLPASDFYFVASGDAFRRRRANINHSPGGRAIGGPPFYFYTARLRPFFNISSIPSFRMMIMPWRSSVMPVSSVYVYSGVCPFMRVGKKRNPMEGDCCNCSPASTIWEEMMNMLLGLAGKRPGDGHGGFMCIFYIGAAEQLIEDDKDKIYLCSALRLLSLPAILPHRNDWRRCPGYPAG